MPATTKVAAEAMMSRAALTQIQEQEIVPATIACAARKATAVTLAAVGSSSLRRAKPRVQEESATPERRRKILPVIVQGVTPVMAIAPAAIRVRAEILAEHIPGEAVPAAAEIAIAARIATITEIIIGGTIGTPTFAIASRTTTTRSFMRGATIPITMTARALMKSATRMACLPARTMAGARKHTIRNARTFTVTQNEGIVPRKETGTLISRLIAMVSFTAIAKGMNTGRIILSAGSSDHDANQIL